MRLILTTIILTMLAQPAWAAEDFTQDEIRQIIAKTENNSVAKALGEHCLFGVRNQAISEEIGSIVEKIGESIVEKIGEEKVAEIVAEMNSAKSSICSCALKFKEVRTASGFDILFAECAAPHQMLLHDLFANAAVNIATKSIETNENEAELSETIVPDHALPEVIQSIQQQLVRCWQPPLTSTAAPPIVDIIVKLDPEGNVIEASVDNMERYGIDKEFRAYANRAQQAVVSCSPITIPSASPELYKTFILSFDPKFLSN